jgi:hypothetical protein
VKLEFVRFWGYYNWCLTPALYFGRSERVCWLKLTWLRGDAGLRLRWE